ncbi:MAG: c-type cytochrome, partial [Phycisphaerae bacterium]|nr:c-type cytochrome [Phycisphaerae bacterium]
GICQDDYGRLYYTSNSRYLFVDWQTHHDAGRKFSGNPVRTSEVFSVRVNPGINRGYQKGMLLKDGRLARVTAVSGPAIYRGDRYPDLYRSSAFICEPAANAVACFTLEETPDGLKSNHLTFPDDRWGKREFLCSTDERFRPVSVYSGPDGCIYVVDMYRGILQHKAYVTTFLRKQILERGLDKPVGLGRIYRIVPTDPGPAQSPPRLQNADSSELVAALSHDNGWWRDTAQRLLVERRDLAAVAALRRLATRGTNHLGRIHALWTLEGMQALDAATVTEPMVADEHVKVRLAALVVSEQVTGDSSLAAVSTRAAVAAAASDPNPQVSSLALHMLKRYAGEIKPTAPAAFAPPAGEHGKRFAAGRDHFMTTCFACHQPNGQGLPGVAPTLVQSQWVTGSTRRLIRIALDGMSGPLQVKGRRLENLPVMPGHRALANDSQLADVLTYVRWEWGNRAGPISAREVREIRAATAKRQLPWTAEELQQLD